MKLICAAAAMFIICLVNWLVVDTMREGMVPLSMSIFMLAGMNGIGGAATLGILRS